MVKKRKRHATKPPDIGAADGAAQAASTSIAERLFQPVDVASIAMFRIAFGLLALWEVFRYFYNNWVWYYYDLPLFHFSYYGFEWVKPWPTPGMYFHFLGLGILAVLIALGWFYRYAMVLFFLGFTFVFLADKTNYLNHFYLICLVSFLLIFVPANRAFSIDCLRRPGAMPASAPAWTLWVLRFQIAVPYVFGGLVKLNSDWLHGQPMQMWMSRMSLASDWLPWFGEHWTALLFSYAGLVFDLSIVPLLLWRRTRLPAFIAAIAFHLFNATMFHIGVFPWFMICATTLFFPADWPRRLFRLPPRQTASDETIPDAQPASRWRRIAIVSLLCLYAGVQLVAPLRHFLYAGNVDWTGQGERFAWRMMLHEQESVVASITIYNPSDGSRVPLDPRIYLTPWQLARMSDDPEMLREFAAFWRREVADESARHAELRFVVLSSLNGRKPQLLVDPNIDLSSQPRNWRSKTWIMPLREPLPTSSPPVSPPSD